MKHFLATALWAALLGLSAACATADERTVIAPDSIVRLADGEPLTRAALLELARGADVVYLGEKHDNPRHHAIENEILRALAENGGRPTLALESMGVEQSGFLLNALAPNPHAVHGKAQDWSRNLRRQLGWAAHRDEEWAAYGPLLETARDKQLEAYGINLPAATILRLTRLGAGGLTPLERRALRPSGYDAAPYRKLMLAMLAESHCGMTAPDYLQRLYETWLARNDHMAAVIVDLLQAGHKPVVVIIGAAHVQHDTGVMERVAALLPTARQLNLGLREIDADHSQLADYRGETRIDDTHYGPLHDYLWFTPRFEAPDPCIAFRQQRGMKHGGADKLDTHQPGTERPR